jgi:hypothetical protein
VHNGSDDNQSFGLQQGGNNWGILTPIQINACSYCWFFKLQEASTLAKSSHVLGSILPIVTRFSPPNQRPPLWYVTSFDITTGRAQLAPRTPWLRDAGFAIAE